MSKREWVVVAALALMGLAAFFMAGCSKAAWLAIGDGANRVTDTMPKPVYVQPQPVYRPAPVYQPAPPVPITPGYGGRRY